MRFCPHLPDETPQYVNTPQLAKLLGVCNGTVLNWVKSGVLPPPIRISVRVFLFDTRFVRKAIAKLLPQTEADHASADQSEKADVASEPPVPAA